jgi:pilus assembly protein TadC
MCGFKQSPKSQILSLEERMEILERRVHKVGTKINFILLCFIIPFVLFYLILPLVYIFTGE